MDDGVVGRLLGEGSCAGVGGVPSANSDEERKEPRVWGRRVNARPSGRTVMGCCGGTVPVAQPLQTASYS